MTPTTPGLWRVRYDGGETADYLVALEAGALWVVAESAFAGPHAASTVKQFTEVLETVGGRWVGLAPI